MNTWSHLREQVAHSLENDPHWSRRLTHIANKDESKHRVHLAVFIEPFLQYVLRGQKTVESRFSANRIAPFGRIDSGDIVLLKRSGGAIVGVCEVTNVWFYDLDPSSWAEIREDFTEALCAQDPAFWKVREHASFATLMRISNPRSLPPIEFKKTDRRGWVVLEDARSPARVE